jgi:hypothetical protein
MADENKSDRGLMVSNLAMTDAAVKLIIVKGPLYRRGVQSQLRAERANYLAVLKHLH